MKQHLQHSQDTLVKLTQSLYLGQRGIRIIFQPQKMQICKNAFGQQVSSYKIKTLI